MSNKKNILIVVIIAIIITLVVSFIFWMNKKEPEPINLNMEQLELDFQTKGRFEDMKTVKVDKSILLSDFKIEEAFVEEQIGQIPLINIKSSMYVVIKATPGKSEYVKQRLEEYAINYEKQWASYLEDQYDLVKKRQIGINGDYVYLIIADTANELKDLIK
ncbi:MAG: DUF4358 domain-containing protein [Clostridia bacterium]